jgi:hypothetical protein
MSEESVIDLYNEASTHANLLTIPQIDQLCRTPVLLSFVSCV